MRNESSQITSAFLRVFREKEFWIALGLAVFYCRRALFFGESFFFRDVYLYFLPQARLFAEFFSLKDLPLWDKYLHGGQPYIASLGNAAWYPFRLLYLVLPLLTAFNLIIALHLAACAAAAYVLARLLGISPVSSLIAGAAYALCGVTLSQINLLHAFLAAPYLPALMICWHLFLLRRQKRWFALAVMAGVMRMLLGASDAYLIGMAILLGWMFCYPYPARSARAKIAHWMLLNFFVFGMSAAQLAPTVEMLSQSARGQGHSFYTLSYWSLSPRRFPESMFPHFSGYTDTLSAADYWGRRIEEDAPFTLILSIYWGAALLFLAAYAGTSRAQSDLFPKKTRRFLLGVLAASMLLAFGKFLPFFALFYDYAPFMRIFRFPIKFLVAGVLPVALLAGCGADILMAGLRRPSRALLAFLWGICAFLLALTVLFAKSKDFSAALQQFFFKFPGDDVSYDGLIISFSHALGIWLMLTLLCHARAHAAGRWQHITLAGIIAADLLIAGKSLNPTAPREFFTATPPVARLIREHLRDGKLYRTTIPRNPILRVPSNSIAWGYAWNLEILADYIAAYYQIPVIFHDDFDKMANFRVINLQQTIDRLAWPQKISLLSAAGVTVILTDADFAAAGVQTIADAPNRSNLTFHLYRNDRALAPVNLVTSWENAASEQDAMQAMLKPDYDPRTHVVIQTPRRASFWEKFGGGASVSAPPSFVKQGGSCGASVIETRLKTSSSLRVAVKSDCAAYLVLPQPFYPEWKARVDGAAAPIMQANAAFSAVFLPAGSHEVEMFYAAAAEKVGIAVSLVSSALLVFVLRRLTS